MKSLRGDLRNTHCCEKFEFFSPMVPPLPPPTPPFGFQSHFSPIKKKYSRIVADGQKTFSFNKTIIFNYISN
jgi:hypothetical protein